jgi:hypothetical protein
MLVSHPVHQQPPSIQQGFGIRTGYLCAVPRAAVVGCALRQGRSIVLLTLASEGVSSGPIGSPWPTKRG